MNCQDAKAGQFASSACKLPVAVGEPVMPGDRVDARIIELKI